MKSETFAGTQGESSSLSDWPMIDEAAGLIMIPTNELCSCLRNQGYWVNPDDRLPLDVIFAALDRELAAGRPPPFIRYVSRKHV